MLTSGQKRPSYKNTQGSYNSTGYINIITVLLHPESINHYCSTIKNKRIMITNFSLKRLTADWKSVFCQYPLTAISTLIAVLWFFIAIANEYFEATINIGVFGLLIVSMANELRLPHGAIPLKRRFSPFYLASLGGWALLVAMMYISFGINDPMDNEGYGYALVALMAALNTYLLIVPNLGDSDDSHILPLARALVLNTLIAGAIAVAIYGVWILTVITSSEIFENTVSDKEYFVWYDIIVFGIGTLLILFSIPDREARNADIPKEESKIKTLEYVLNKYIIMPLVIFFIAVMLIYAVRILITWELPKVRLSILVSIIMVCYVVSYTFLYDYIKNSSGWLNKLYTRYIPIAFLPLVTLMLIGVCKRFSDYGITANRLYILTVNAFYFFICLYMLFSKQKRFSIIYIVFVAAFLLTTVQPLNYHKITEMVLQNQQTTEMAQDLQE